MVQVSVALVTSSHIFILTLSLAQALKLFLPFIHKKLMGLVTEATMQEESFDKEVLWNLQMMSEIVRSNGQELIKYKSMLVDVLKKSLRMTCKEGIGFLRLLQRNSVEVFGSSPQFSVSR